MFSCDLCKVFKNKFSKKTTLEFPVWNLFTRNFDQFFWHLDLKVLLNRTSTFQKSWFYLPQLKSFKNNEKYFLFILKTPFVLNLKIFKFLSWYFSQGKQPGNKDKVNFKNYDIINWETNNLNTHIIQYLERKLVS